MPLVNESYGDLNVPVTETDDSADVDDALLFKDGRLTLEADTIAAFLRDVDFDDVFEDPDVQEHIEGEFFLGRHVQDPDTGAIHLEVFAEAEDVADADLQAHGEEVEERAYGKKKGKMRGKKMDYAEEDDESADEGESQGTMPAHGSLSAATRAGMVGMMNGAVRIGYGNGTPPTSVGKGDKQHQPGAKPFDPAEYDGQMSYAMKTEDRAPEGLEWFVRETLPGHIVAEVVDFEDLLAMLPHFIAELPEDTLEDRARKALFHDLTEIDYAAAVGLDPDDVEGIEEARRLFEKAKRPFKKGQFRTGPFAGAKQGEPAHSMRMRMMQAMLKKGAIHRVGKGKGYKKGGYDYRGPKSGRPGLIKAYKRYKLKKIGPIKKTITKHKVGKVQKKVVKDLIYRNLGARMPGGWVPPQERKPGFGTGLSKAGAAALKKMSDKDIEKEVAAARAEIGAGGGGGAGAGATPPTKTKKKAQTKKGARKTKGKKQRVAASAAQVPANLTETEGYRLTRSYTGSGPRLAGLVESHVRGGRAEHQEAIAAEEAAKRQQLNG